MADLRAIALPDTPRCQNLCKTVHARVTCGRNHKIAQSAEQRRSHVHKSSVLLLCNLVVLYADIHPILE